MIIKIKIISIMKIITIVNARSICYYLSWNINVLYILVKIPKINIYWKLTQQINVLKLHRSCWSSKEREIEREREGEREREREKEPSKICPNISSSITEC